MALGLVLTTCFLLYLPISNFHKNKDPIPPSTALISLDSPVTIYGDGNFTGYPGNGSKADPYRIENLTIDGAAGDYCIIIAHTTVNFIIKNCTVFNAVSGIVLNNLTFGEINNSVAYDTTRGFDLIRVVNSSLSNNTAYANLVGFGLVRVNHTTLFNNTSNNNVKGDYGDGIELNNCWFNDILNNTLNDNKGKGIYLIESHYNTIRGNTILGNDLPWEEDSCSNNTFEDNNAEWPDDIEGFQLILSLLSLLALSLILVKRKQFKYIN